MLKPQEGFQEMALSTPADIAIIGGSAGGGKSWLLEVEPLRHYKNPNFGATIFRRTTTQIKAQGGLWDTSKKIYYHVNGSPKESSLEWFFPSGAKVKFAHLEHEKDVYNYQGSQIPYIAFDELTHFTELMFWYMASRNRTDCGVKPYIRASCNPDPSSWVAKLIEWWIDQETGYPIKERNGVLRYFTRDGDAIVWGNTKQEVIEQAPHIFQNEALLESGVDLEDMVKSFTFIAGNIYENKLFIKSDPGYLGTLLALQPEEKARLLDGNWKVSLDGLMIALYDKIERIYDNYPEQSLVAKKYITVDAARSGRDFAVIMVWKGWECIYLVVFKLSDAHDITNCIERLRMKFSVTKDNVVVDADGVGDGTVKLGGYVPFHGGASPIKEPEELAIVNGKAVKTKRTLINYKNLKTQCYYRLCQKRINPGQIRFSWNNETVEIYDSGSATPVHSTKIKVGGQFKDVRDLLKEDLRTVKRLETANEGVDKIQMQPKETQKNTLKRSPDFSDTAMIREFLELRGEKKGMHQTN